MLSASLLTKRGMPVRSLPIVIFQRTSREKSSLRRRRGGRET